MDIDPDITNWVLEFLLRQPMDDRTLDSLLQILPLLDTVPNFKKLLLLKKLESDVSSGSISEGTLGLLEQLGEMDFRGRSGNVFDALRRAYCAVAVECTVKVLANEGMRDNLGRFRYFETVKRVWRGRVGRIKKAGMGYGGGLGSDELWAWKDEIEASVWDDDVYVRVMKKSMEINAVEAIRSFVREERERMGPSFLEVVAARMKDDELLQGLMLGAGNIDRVVGEECCQGAGLIEDGRNANNKEIQKGKIHLRNKVVGLRHNRGNSRRAELVDSNETTEGPLCQNYNLVQSAEVHRVREALELSSLELKAAVKDPLPEALRFAKAISEEARPHKHNSLVEENCIEANYVDGGGIHQPICRDARTENSHHDPEQDNSVEADIVNGAEVDGTSGCNANNVQRPSLMKRNATAHTYEWDDSIDTPQGDPSDSRGRLLLPSPVGIKASPLKTHVSFNLKRRRQPKKWTPLEEDALRAGVQKFGKGNWKLILSAYNDKFDDRTEGDLKDKWRNMTRHGEL